MLANYKKRGHISAAIWLIAVIAAAVMAPGISREVWERLQPATVVAGIGVAAWCYAFIAYAQAKGYPVIAGLLLALLNVPGAFILILLKDKHRAHEHGAG